MAENTKAKDTKKVEAKEEEAQVREDGIAPTPEQQQEYIKEVTPKSNKPDGIENAADKRLRSEKVALRLAQEHQEARAAQLQKEAAAFEAALASIPGMLTEIDSGINGVIEDGVRSFTYTVPVDADEHVNVTKYKVDILVAELVDLGYTVLNMWTYEPEVPVAAGDEEDAEEAAAKEDADADDDDADTTTAPVLVISW